MIRFPAYTLTLAIMLASAALVVGVLWLGFSLLFSMGTYIETVLP